jgi:hypothetical protein
MTDETPRRPEPVLIGPAGAGKSTVGNLLASRLGVPLVDLDAIGHTYYEEVGQGLGLLRARIERDGYPTAHEWWQPARAHAVERATSDHRDCVFALGAGHTHYEEPAHFERVRSLLARFAHVILLLPSPDPEVSIEVLRRRCSDAKGHDGVRDGVDFLRVWVTSEQNDRLATDVVHTDGLDPSEIAARIACSVRTL